MTVLYPPRIRGATIELYNGTGKTIGDIGDVVHIENFSRLEFLTTVNSVTVGASPAFAFTAYFSADGENWESTGFLVGSGLTSVITKYSCPAAAATPYKTSKYIKIQITASTDITAIDWECRAVLKA